MEFSDGDHGVNNCKYRPQEHRPMHAAVTFEWIQFRVKACESVRLILAAAWQISLEYWLNTGKRTPLALHHEWELARHF